MKKLNKKSSSLFSYVYLLLIPAIFSVLTCLFGKVNLTSYNETFLKNVVNEVNDPKKQVVLSLENKKDNFKQWDTYSTLFNRDFYGYNALFRVSKESYEAHLESEISANVLLSDIEQCDIINNQFWNFSALYTKTSMEGFAEDSIFISKEIADTYSIETGDEISFNGHGEDIILKVFGIYDSNSTRPYYLNSSYYELGEKNPICFTSKTIFNKLSSKSYNGYLSVLCDTEMFESAYLELDPLLSANNIKFEVKKGLSVNNININDMSIFEYQSYLLKAVNKENKTIYYLYLSFMIPLFVVNCLLSVYLLRDVVNKNKNLYKYSVILCFFYFIFILSGSLISAFLLKKFFYITTLSGIKLYHSLKLPLILISMFTIVYMSIFSIVLAILYKKRKGEYQEERKNELARFQKENKKLIFVTSSLSRGGAEKVIVELANFYAKQGKKVDIVILLNNKVEWDLHENVTVVNFTGNTSSRIKRIGFWLRSLKQYFNDNKHSTIVSFLVRVNILVLLSAKSKDHKIIISERNDPRFDGRNFVIDCFTNFLYPKADKVVFQTKECKELFSNRIQSKGVVISNPIRIEKYASVIDYKKKYFVSAGRISKQKNQITMIKAMTIVCSQYKDVILEIYGDGDLSETLNEKIKSLGLKNNVFIYPNTKDINSKLIQSTAYISTSIYEGMSNSLMEASFAGVPCITTKCLGTDFIKDGRNGYFINFYDYKELAKLLVELLNNEEKINMLRKESYDMAISLSHEDVYNQWKGCIENE